MKKLFSLLALTTILGLTACGPTSNPTTEPSVGPTSTPTTSVEEPTTNPSTTTNPTFTLPDTSDEPVTYEFGVTVLYEDETPFAGARVQACTEDGSKCFMPVSTNEEGYATLNLELGTYVVHVINVPEGYYYDEDGYIISEANQSVTIVLFQAQDTPRQW